MTKKAAMSECRDTENRSKKSCVCGGHNAKAKKKRKRWSRGACFRKRNHVDTA